MKILFYSIISPFGVIKRNTRLSKLFVNYLHKVESKELIVGVKIKGVKNLCYVPLFGEVVPNIDVYNEGVKPKHLRTANEFVNGKRMQNKTVRTIRACRSSINNLENIAR